MKKYILSSFAILSTLLLISWGFEGHQIVARIAENHLTPQAKAAVHDLLGEQNMVEVASWADQVRNTPEYKNTGGWHFLNLPLGLNVDQFETQVKTQTKENVYSAFLANEYTLERASSTREQKAEALKFIIHLVGDAHQPMHISRAEDKGGNTIQVQFDGKGTNLHNLWDSKLLDKQRMSDVQIAKELDKATPAQIKKWQSENVLYWLWESYQITSKLYPEVEKNNKLGEDYYNAHIGIVNERLEKAGIRLAGVLNDLFKGYVSDKLAHQAKSLDITPDSSVVSIGLEDLKGHIGQQIGTEGKVYDHRNMGSMVLVNVGAAYPNQKLTLVLRGEAKNIASELDGKTITIIGKVIDYKGRPEIEINDVRDVIIQK